MKLVQVVHLVSQVLHILFSKYLPEAQDKQVVAVFVQVIHESLSQSEQVLFYVS